MQPLAVEPLTASAFAPFGHVVTSDTVAPLAINQGFASRWNDISAVDVAEDGGRVQVCLFEATPRPATIAIEMMERHPLGSQMFYPLQDRPWLVVVCGEPLVSSSYRAFRATGRQGIGYSRNVWHHPLLVLDGESRFIVVDRAGPGSNLEEVWLPAAQKRALRDIAS